MSGAESSDSGPQIKFGQKFTGVRSRAQFHQFFPAWRPGLKTALERECASEITAYYDPEVKDTGAAYWVIRCLLDATPNFRQVEMNTSSVILGLTPVLMQALGLTMAQTSMLSLRRPGLAILLRLGSPATNPLRSTEYMKAIHELEDVGGWYPQRLSGSGKRRLWARRILTGVMYAAAFGAVANTCLLAYHLGYWSISTFSVQTTFLPAVWSAMALPMHLVGAFAFRLRVQKIGRAEDGPQSRSASIVRWLRQNLWPPADPPETRLRIRKDHALFYILSWSLYIAVQGHSLFGIMLLSGMLFISVTDSLGIAGRLCASAIVCRLVVMIGLMEMQQKGLHVDRGEHASPPVDDDEIARGLQSDTPSGHADDDFDNEIELRQLRTWA